MPAAEEPLYRRIAEDLRRQIEAGELAEGAKLTAERELAEEWGASRTTIRQAIRSLVDDGLVYADSPRGTFVRARPALQIRSRRHYRYVHPGETTSPFARDAEREGKRPDWDWESNEVAASAAVARRLGIQTGDAVMQTDYLFKADDRPVQMSRSWEPLDITRGTRIERPEGPGRIVGVIARFDAIKVRIDRVVETVSARPAASRERQLLAIPPDVWLITIDRTQYAGTRAVEITDIVIPADRYALEYDLPVLDAED